MHEASAPKAERVGDLATPGETFPFLPSLKGRKGKGFPPRIRRYQLPRSRMLNKTGKISGYLRYSFVPNAVPYGTIQCRSRYYMVLYLSCSDFSALLAGFFIPGSLFFHHFFIRNFFLRFGNIGRKICFVAFSEFGFQFI